MNKVNFNANIIALSESEDGTKLFGKVLVCPLDEGNLNGKGIKSTDLSEDELKTLIEQPAVCKVIKNFDGALNLSGHGMKKVQEYNSETNKLETKVYFDTNPIGFFNTSTIEDIEIDGVTKKCIVANVTFWKRYSNAISVIQKLYDEGNLHVSYELTFSETYDENDVTWMKGICFFGVAVLGTGVQSAYPMASVIELSELDSTDIDFELAQAFTQDLINEINKDTHDIQSSSTDEVKDIIITPEISEINEQGGEKMDKTTNEVASLTDNDLYRKVRQAINAANPNDWFYISYLFPMEYRAVAHNWESTDTQFVEFKYSVNSDETVSITSQTNVEMQFVLVSEIETMVAEKDAKDTQIVSLNNALSEKKTELSTKIESITKLGEQISLKEAEIAELIPFKEKVEASELAEKEAELAQKKEDLKAYATKSGFLTVEDLETPEIAELIENLDEKSIKVIIAEKVIAKLEISEAEKVAQELALAEKAKETEKEVDIAELKDKTPKTNINTSTKDDITSPLSIMDKFLSK